MQVKLFLSLSIRIVDWTQFLPENRLNGWQIFWRFGNQFSIFRTPLGVVMFINMQQYRIMLIAVNTKLLK